MRELPYSSRNNSTFSEKKERSENREESDRVSKYERLLARIPLRPILSAGSRRRERKRMCLAITSRVPSIM